MSLEKDVSTFLMENETSPKPSKAWPFQGNIKYIFCMIMNWFIMIGLFVCIINHYHKLKTIEKKSQSTQIDIERMDSNLNALIRNIVPENGTLNATVRLEIKLYDLKQRIMSLIRSMGESFIDKIDGLSLEMHGMSFRINISEENTKNRLDDIHSKSINDYEDLKSNLTALKETQLTIQHDLSSTDSDLPALRSMMNLTMQQVIPMGFIYTQLPFQNPPQIIWPWATWKDITSNYSGHFFRAEGGDSAPFGTAQLDAIRDHKHHFGPRLTSDFVSDDQRVKVHSRERTFLTLNGKTGSIDSSDLNSEFISQTETRPKNFAVRIWMRL